MSSPTRDSHNGGSNQDHDADPSHRELLRDGSLTPQLSDHDTDPDPDPDPDRLPQTPSFTSPVPSASIPDDSPSIYRFPVSTPIRPTASRVTSISRTPSGPSSLDRRFQSRFSLSPSSSYRASPSRLLTPYSHQSSASFRAPSHDGGTTPDPEDAPWEVIRWTRLRNLARQCFSEAAKRQFGTPTCLAISASIAIGTSKGLVLVFDVKQSLRSVIGQGTVAAESGPVTSLAIAADHTTIAAGHATGHILTWELAHPAKPFLHVPPLVRSVDSASPDGHVPGRAILHVGFLGTRHTALVSADDAGMAFSHLATRGLGSVARSVKCTRLLGRYPSVTPSDASPRKPSSVLAFGPLPLGNVEEPTDTMGLTAMLTPYLLVIVSTTPVAQTQHKLSRPKDLIPHGAVSGCLAWFPAVKLKTEKDGRKSSNPKLVYCWSEVLSVLDIEVDSLDDDASRDQQPSLYFHTRGRWTCPEAIVAVQWLSRSVIGVLTISQRLIIIQDGTLHVIDSVDLLQKHIYHQDYFSTQLRTVVEESEQDAAIHGVVADAFCMSFRVYKGRLFLLCFSDLEVGLLSNWADRLTALVEHGDDIAAIRLAINYYTNNTGVVSVGLSEDPDTRHQVVHERLLDLVMASLAYRFSDRVPKASVPSDLTPACFDACLAVDEQDHLLDTIYDLFRDANHSDIFLDVLEDHIMNKEITRLPPALVQDLVSHYVARSQSPLLEELLCRLDATTFDLDQVTKLCKAYMLYDALAYVWNQAMKDWVTPTVEYLSLFRDVKAINPSANKKDDQRVQCAAGVFTYLAFSLTGRTYPGEELMDEEEADMVKFDLYSFLFADQPVEWPVGSHETFRTRLDGGDESNFPYIRQLLDLDTSQFMSMLNEAFEDPYLNVNQDFVNGNSLSVTRRKLTRQHIISILTDIMSGDDVAPTQKTYLDIFIARCLPKFPQFVILSESSLQSLVERLCEPQQDPALSEECELSVEYLCSVYQPPVNDSFLSALGNAGFYRVLKSVYRAEADAANFLKVSFEHEMDPDVILSDTSECLRLGVDSFQRSKIEDVICDNAVLFLRSGVAKAAWILFVDAKDLLSRFTESLQSADDPTLLFEFLRALLEPALCLEPNTISQVDALPDLENRFTEQYVQLMCSYDPGHVADYVRTLESSNLRLDRIRSALEESDRVDAIVLLLAREGLIADAMSRLVKHLDTCTSGLCGLMSSLEQNPASLDEALSSILHEIDVYIKLGIWLCKGQTESKEVDLSSGRARDRQQITLNEQLWVDLMETIVKTTKDVLAVIAESQLQENHQVTRSDGVVNALRQLVQLVFTAVLSSTTSTKGVLKRQAAAPLEANQSFLRIFRAFLERAATTSPSLPDLRTVLLDIFAAYTYEYQVLGLAHRLLSTDTFHDVERINDVRNRGWRPRAQVCESCKRRAWGPGCGDAVWREWARSEDEKKKGSMTAGLTRGSKGKGNGKGREMERSMVLAAADQVQRGEAAKMALVVFACRHCYHRDCLRSSGAPAGGDGGFECLVCRPGSARRTGG